MLNNFNLEIERKRERDREIKKGKFDYLTAVITILIPRQSLSISKSTEVTEQRE